VGFFDKFQRRGPVVRDEYAEIVVSVGRILSTKRGFGALDERLGLSDLSATTSRASLANTLRAEIAENLKLYEPRVEIAHLTEFGGPARLRLRFELVCSLAEGKRALYLIYNREKNRFMFEQTETGSS
jgi:phage baseplate assembly protein W